MARFEDPTPERPVPLGRYELVERIGFGGMAEVFRARLPGPAGFSKTVVIKRILPRLSRDPLMVRMFVEEARIAAAADHDNIAKVYELGRTDDGQYFMVMEFIDGIDLELLLQQAAQRTLKMPTWFSLHVVAQVLEALSFVHGLVDEQGQPRNVIHRDATPSNIFVSHLGQVKLSDFGVADFVGKSPTTQAGQLKGKLAYMSPEQLRARALDARADVFSVGVVLWEALTQERLFGHLNEMQAMMAICEPSRPPPSTRVSGLTPRIDEICAKALALDRKDRFPSAEAFQAELLDVLHTLHRPVRPSDVQQVLEQLAGKQPPAPETQADAPEPTRDKSFLVPIGDFGADLDESFSGPDTVKSERSVVPPDPPTQPPPLPPQLPPPLPPPSGPTPVAQPKLRRDLESTESDLMATVDEPDDPAVALEIAELRALMEQRGLEVGPPTELLMEEGVLERGAVPVGMEISGDQTVAGKTVRSGSGSDSPPQFWVRSAAGRPSEALPWGAVAARAAQAAEAGHGFEVSADGKAYATLEAFGRLTGQDLSYELDPPSNVTVVGSLAKTSLCTVLSRLAIDRTTGVLTVARPADGAWYELEVHQGRPTKLVSPVPSTQLPQVLIDRGPFDAQTVAQLCQRALREHTALSEVVKAAGGPDVSHVALSRIRLEIVYGWQTGDYTFNADRTRPQQAQAFADSLMCLLPTMVAQVQSVEQLQNMLQSRMQRRMSPETRLYVTQALFTAEQRTLISRLLEGPLGKVLPIEPPQRRNMLAVAHVLIEAGLAT